MRLSIASLIAVMALAMGASLVHAAPPAPSLRLVTLVFPPLEFANAKGEADGAAVEIVKAVLSDMGYTATVEVLPWSRSLNLVKEGKADAIFTAYKNPEREGFLDFGREVLIPQVVSLYIKADSGKTFNGDVKELIGQRIGIMNTISYGQTFDRAKDELGLKTERVESLDLNFKKLAAGRLDYVISNRYSAQVEIDALGLEKDVKELVVPVEVMPSFIAFSKAKKLEGLRDKFDVTLRELKKSGRYYKILEKFKVRIPRSS
jgi:polar amino acid transport system substrate-binding protein